MPKHKPDKRVLVVEDEPNWQNLINELVQEIASALGYTIQIVSASSFAEASGHIATTSFDCVTVDNQLQDGTMANTLLDRIVRLDQKVPVVVISGVVDPSDVRDFFKDYQIEEFFWKRGFKPKEFRQTLTRLLAHGEEQDNEKSESLESKLIDAQLLVKSLPTGLLHLYSRDDLPLLKYNITNTSDKPFSVIVSSEIEQFSYTRSDTIRLSPGQSKTITQLPTLRLDQIAAIYEVRKAVVHTHARCIQKKQELILFAQDYDIQFLARDVLIWAIIVDDDIVHDLSYQIAAWVTPNARPIVDMLRRAADYFPTGQLWGYQNGGTEQQRAGIVREQVKAIFQALKERGRITYINAPISFGQKANEVQQRVNLPRDSLKHRQANCIDGAVLYASLIERAAMNPVIVIVPRHAFVGWETWDGSRQYEFLETTMTGSHTFEEALETGMQEFEDVRSLVGRPLFDPRGFAVLLDIKALHERGILPAD